MKTRQKPLRLPQIIIFLFLIILFCYFRLRPIYFQTVPYTFDQGRDFLKAAEIVRDHNPTFIGPATGIDGVYHGVWWYYFLTIPYIIFNGWPEGFYYAVFFIHLVASLAFTVFLIRQLSWLTGILFFSVVAVSPYFIKISTFPISSTLGPVFMLGFLYCLYQIIENPKPTRLFFFGLSLGFLGESELPIALYFYPTFFLLWLILPFFRHHIFRIKNLLSFICGFLIPLLPRLLFELKNNFIQTKALINFIFNPSATHPQSLVGAVDDRFNILLKFYYQIFYYQSPILSLFILFPAVIIAFCFFKKYSFPQKNLIFFLTLSLPVVYLLMVINRNNFFWDNYFEGIQFFYLFIILILLQPGLPNRFVNLILSIVVGFFVGLNFFHGYLFIIDNRPPPVVGLKGDLQTVVYILQKNNKDRFCLRIYTPPVIPHTYHYLFSYFSWVKNYPTFTTDFVNNQCWYIIDDEVYQERVVKWRNQHLPKNARRLTKKILGNQTQVELWQLIDEEKSD